MQLFNHQIYGEGKQTRSFQYVSDLVDGLVALMNSNYTLPVNIGNPEEYTVNDFAEIIRNLVGMLTVIVFHYLNDKGPWATRLSKHINKMNIIPTLRCTDIFQFMLRYLQIYRVQFVG